MCFCRVSWAASEGNTRGFEIVEYREYPLYSHHLPKFVGEKVCADDKLMMMPISFVVFHGL
jgi:hypothetical protein